MILIKKISDISRLLESARNAGKSIGFVPTMGALHPGHVSLISASRAQTDLTVCSIFVNPTQFNDPADFRKYPVTIEKDIEMLDTAGCHVLFYPSVDEVYPSSGTKPAHYDLGPLESVFEGQFRPGHFQGVCQVMDRLLSIVQPHQLFMGQKDYQQCKVVNRLIELRDWNIKLVPGATLREKDGLAMSSRNMRLTPEQRQRATGIYKALSHLRDSLQPGDLMAAIAQAEAILAEHQFRTDYIAIADAKSLQPVHKWDGNQQLVAVAAAFQGEVRLIDNMLLN